MEQQYTVGRYLVDRLYQLGFDLDSDVLEHVSFNGYLAIDFCLALSAHLVPKLLLLLILK